ncbi:MAG TPA: caspase family protein [Thermoanaerobaculia bacterium]|nr:caspase family protein [Thermoanaerobaculia bacterium]
MPGQHALLIGIDQYPKLPPERQLQGCVNDVQLIAHLLAEQFGFPPESIVQLCDEQATQDNIRAALDKLAECVAPGDSVVITYSGHGSQLRNGSQRPEDWNQCIVPYDSGRNPHPNRDIRDSEIHRWLLTLSGKTPNICLILDSCFSAGALRSVPLDRFAAPVRWLEPDDRPLSAPEVGPAFRSGEAKGDAKAWLPSSERCVLLSACRSEEYAYMVDSPSHGALTFYLAKELKELESGATYLDLFERFESQVVSRFPSQHPQLHGARHREVFGLQEIHPMLFVSVRERSNGRVLLGGGAAHGLETGSEWKVYPTGTRNAAPSDQPLGKVKVVEVDSVSACADVQEERTPGCIQPGARAVQASPSYWRMRVELAPVPDHGLEEWLKTWIPQQMKLRLAKPGETGDVRVYLLNPRSSAGPGDPVPQLGPISRPTWAVVSRDGTLRMPLISAESPESVQCLARNLGGWANYHFVKEIKNRQPRNPLQRQVKARLLRKGPARGWLPAEKDAEAQEVVYEVGEPVAIRVQNDSDQQVYVYMLDLGLTGAVTQVYPFVGVGHPLSPGSILEIGTDPAEELNLFFPEGFPFSGRDNGTVQGIEYLKVFGVLDPTDFGPLLQEAPRLFKPWMTKTLSFLVRRTAHSL